MNAGDCGEKKPASRRINSFRELNVYRDACALDETIFNETKKWPKEEKFALIDQIRRSSRAIGANLAESWAKRRYPAHFISKLTDADGELQETEHWLNRAQTYGYLSHHDCELLSSRCQAIGRQIGRMIQAPGLFC
jgi:four helix bundle protein